MRQCGPAWKKNSVPPLRQNFQPRVQVKFNVVSRRSTEEEKWNLDRERCGSKRDQPQPGLLREFVRRAK